VVSTGNFGVTSGLFSIPLQVTVGGIRAHRGSDKKGGPCLREFIGDEQNYLVPLAADVALLPVPRFNPIVFHGPTGTGKTFLARGLVQLRNSTNPNASSVITSGVDFARDYANAVVTDSLPDFRKRFRSPAMLMVDDLDRLQDKVPAQSEMIKTLDELERKRCQVLVTMKEAPLETAGLAPALASRLSGGLSVPMTTPGHTGRQAILAQLLKLHDVKLTDEAMDLLVRSPLFAPVGSASSFADLTHLVNNLLALTAGRSVGNWRRSSTALVGRTAGGSVRPVELDHPPGVPLFPTACQRFERPDAPAACGTSPRRGHVPGPPMDRKEPPAGGTTLRQPGSHDSATRVPQDGGADGD
jgi:hypothetical protein